MPHETQQFDAELPGGFEMLAQFVGAWGPLATEDERYLHRQRTDMAELQYFYATMVPMLEPIFQHLDRFSYGPLPPPERNLLRLALGLAEAAQAVEVIGHPKVPSAPHDLSIPIVRIGREP